MPEKFYHFRISLKPSALPDLFIDKISREDFLNNVFGESFAFTHFGKEFFYKHLETVDGVIISSIGKRFESIENRPPDEDFQPTIHEGWKAAVMIIDPKDHADGQKIAFSHDTLVGKPSSLIKSIVKDFNSREESYYHTEIEPIFNPQSFWDFAEANKGNITRLAFYFTTPNMFKSETNLEDELRSMRDKENAEKVKIEIQSSEGLETNTDTVKTAVDYTKDGIGSVTAQAKNGKHFNSKNSSTFVRLEDDPSESESLIQQVLKNIRKLLGND